MRQNSSEENALGARIRALRTARQLSQEALAERLDVSRQAVTRWESGAAKPSTANLLALAACLEAPLEELTGAVPPAPPQETRRPPVWPQAALCALPAVLALLGWVLEGRSRVPADVIGYADGPADLWVQGVPWPLWLLTAAAVLCAILAVRRCLRARRKGGGA